MAIDLGDSIERTVLVTDNTGTPVNADNPPTYQVLLPDGTADTPPPVAQSGVGRYFVIYTTSQAGLHEDVWTAEVSAVPVVFRDSFRVREVIPGILSLGEARQVLGLGVDPIRDEQIRNVLASVATIMEDRTGYNYRRRTVVEEYGNAAGRDRIVLRSPPAISITTVVDNGVTLPATSYRLDAENGILWLRAGLFVGPVVVTYPSGQTNVTDNVLECAREILRILWGSRGGATGTPRRTAGTDGQPERTIEAALSRLTEQAPVIA